MHTIFSYPKNYIFLLLSIIVFICFAFYSKNFKLDASSDTLILQNDESFKFYNYYNNIFPTKNFLVLAIKSDKEIDIEYINKIKQIKKNLEKIEGIESIFSILDAPILLTSKLRLQDLNQKEIPTLLNSDYELKEILNEFSKSPIFKDQIINNNKNISSIIINLKENKKYQEIKNIKNNTNYTNSQKQLNIEYDYRKLKEEYINERRNLILNIRDTLKRENISYTYFLGGIDMIADDTLRFIKNDIIVFSISVFIFIFIVLFLIFKSLKWVLIPLISTLYAIICMVGLIGFLKWEVTAISSNFISLMLILSISMCIHIINNYRLNFNKDDSVNSLKKTLKVMFWPCFYTSLTTIVAFGSLIFSDIKPVIDFGKIMILSLLIILISSFTILPLIISFFPKIDENKNYNFSILNYFFKISINHKIKIYLINFLIFCVSIYGIYKLNVENSFINYFKKDTEIYKGMKLIDMELGGTTPIDIIVKYKNEDLIIESQENINEDNDDDIDIDIDETLFIDDISNVGWFTEEKINTIRSIHEYLESKDQIGKVQSLYSLIDKAEKINKQKLSIFELSILYNEIPENYKKQLLSPFLSTENNMIKITARVKDSEKINRKELIDNIRNHLNNNYSSVEEIKVNGLLVLYNNMLQSLFTSQIKSFGIVLFSIFIMFLILFRSIKLSFIGIIPNIFASTFILGLIGLIGIPLDIMTITIAAITIGIAVDNTIHYLYKTKDNIIDKKMMINESLKDSHKTVGQAVLTTSLTIAFGFSVLCLSNFIPTILFGLFTSLAMIIAMLGVLITLPAGLLKTDI